nr:hypothetical protein Iba_chr15fCG6670 [Ipomoea batatas]
MTEAYYSAETALVTRALFFNRRFRRQFGVCTADTCVMIENLEAGIVDIDAHRPTNRLGGDIRINYSRLLVRTSVFGLRLSTHAISNRERLAEELLDRSGVVWILSSLLRFPVLKAKNRSRGWPENLSVHPYAVALDDYPNRIIHDGLAPSLGGDAGTQIAELGGLTVACTVKKGKTCDRLIMHGQEVGRLKWSFQISDHPIKPWE